MSETRVRSGVGTGDEHQGLLSMDDIPVLNVKPQLGAAINWRERWCTCSPEAQATVAVRE